MKEFARNSRSRKSCQAFSMDLLQLLDCNRFLFDQMPSLTRLAPQKCGNLELVLFDCPGLIGAAAMRVHRRVRSSLRGWRMLRAFAVLGMNRTRLLLRVDLPLLCLPRGRLPVARARTRRHSSRPNGLGKLDEDGAYRLSLAAHLIEAGMTPRELARELGLGQVQFGVSKYDENQPRVPAGSGRESGQWT